MNKKTKQKIVLIGAGPLGMNVAHIIQMQKLYDIVGFVDSKKGTIAGFPILGDDSMLASLFEQGVRTAFVSIGNAEKRISISMNLKKQGFSIPRIVHPSADLGLQASLGEGTVLFHSVFVGPETEIGSYCIVEAGVCVGHNANIHDGVLLSVKALVGNSVTIGRNATLKIAAQCAHNVRVGANCTINEFSLLSQDLADGSTY